MKPSNTTVSDHAKRLGGFQSASELAPLRSLGKFGEF